MKALLALALAGALLAGCRNENAEPARMIASHNHVGVCMKTARHFDAVTGPAAA